MNEHETVTIKTSHIQRADITHLAALCGLSVPDFLSAAAAAFVDEFAYRDDVGADAAGHAEAVRDNHARLTACGAPRCPRIAPGAGGILTPPRTRAGDLGMNKKLKKVVDAEPRPR